MRSVLLNVHDTVLLCCPKHCFICTWIPHDFCVQNFVTKNKCWLWRNRNNFCIYICWALLIVLYLMCYFLCHPYILNTASYHNSFIINMDDLLQIKVCRLLSILSFKTMDLNVPTVIYYPSNILRRYLCASHLWANLHVT